MFSPSRTVDPWPGKKHGSLSFRGLILFFLILNLTRPAAAEVSLSLQANLSDVARLTLRNSGDTPLTLGAIQMKIDEDSHQSPMEVSLMPGESHSAVLPLPTPQREGTHPVFIQVFYKANGRSLTHLGGLLHHFGVGRPHRVVTPGCVIPSRSIHGRGYLPIFHDPAISARLVVPSGVILSSPQKTLNGSLFEVGTRSHELSQAVNAYGVLEGIDENGVQWVALCQARVDFPATYRELPLSGGFLVFGVVLSFFISLWCFHVLRRRSSQALYSLTRGAFTAFLTFSALLVLSELGSAIDRATATQSYLFLEEKLLDVQAFSAFHGVLQLFYLDGADYQYFRKWVVVPLIAYVICGNYFVLRYQKQPDPKRDKYWHGILITFSLLPIFRKAVREKSQEPFVLNRGLAATAWRATLVKIFFFPLLSNWTFQNLFHLKSLVFNAEYTFQNLYFLILGAFIFMDVAIFTAGYCTELPQLGNEIRSVETTFFGWLVCLVCYPPLNSVLFTLVDGGFRSSATLPASLILVGSVLTLILWGIYLSATIALGWKASNLTNRGIVSSGPYRSIRHPAYISKLLVWLLAAICFAEMSWPLWASLAFIYVLRAWTEERHLSADPEYREYAQQVRWRMIPGLW